MGIKFFKGEKLPEIKEYYEKKSKSMTSFISNVTMVILKDEDETITAKSMGKFKDRHSQYDTIIDDIDDLELEKS